MKRMFLPLVLLLIAISCEDNLCRDFPPEGCEFPKIYWIKFYPKNAKIGETVTIIYEKENVETVSGLNYNNDFEVTSEGQIKYIGNYSEISMNYTDEKSRIKDDFTYIYSEKNTSSEIKTKITNFLSLSESPAASPNTKIIELQFKVPENAKSGYIWTIDPMHFAKGGNNFSEEKLIIVDENGKEITE